MNSEFEVQGFPGPIQKLTSTNTAQAFPADLLARLGDSMKPVAVCVTCETNDVRVTWDGTTPTSSAGTSLGHIIYAGQSLRLTNRQSIQNFRFISKTADSHGVLHVTPEYETSFGQVA